MPSEKVNEATRREWRDLGFFYDRNDSTKEWQIRGSRAGLLRFAQELLDYSKNPRNQKVPEHDHLGPYMYLTIGTWSEPILDDYWIAGSVKDLSRLSALICEQVSQAKVGDVIRFRNFYAPSSPYELILEVANDKFDPASADKLLVG